MKSFLIIEFCLVAIVCGQAQKPTQKPGTAKPSNGAQPNVPQSNGKSGSSDPCDPTKQPRADMKQCCPGYPDFSKAAFMEKCGKQCLSAASNKNLSICCLSQCFLSENKAINTDGSINAANVVSTVLSYSALKTKPTYSAFVAKVVDECIKVAKNISDKRKNDANNCLTAYFEGCLMRGLFINCTDASPNKTCTDLQAYAASCKRFPMMDHPSVSAVNKAHASAANGKPPSSGATGKPQGPPSSGKPSSPPNPNPTKQQGQQPTNKATKMPPAPPTPPNQTKSTKTPHPSQSEHGTLGKNGAGLKP
ncbi:hypothetical protein PVAND_003258 [Polypedilum vanderplanki]|uniref:Uncharacterized protein n=1 Tax=Polypedilum vanderplanki TaxID=319348 RepID=A0A9J6BTH6_POLVA|nr:hypothetical protein PVAND_003258 [Polypedilum vanderplanki]